MSLISAMWNGRDPGGSLIVGRPPIKSNKLEAKTVNVPHSDHLKEYAELAAITGVRPPDLGIEDFKRFLIQSDIPTFSLTEVIAYMDDKAAKESKEKCGWEWHPLRPTDHIKDAKFGKEATRQWSGGGEIFTAPASDFYQGPHMIQHNWNGVPHHYDHSGNRIYDKTIPLHALRKVALIGKQFGDAAKFFVCDYALAPAIQYPDPFLMVVMPNGEMDKGIGRFIIDFWDEPGFGLDKQLK